MKKIVVLVITLVCMFSLTACGSKKTGEINLSKYAGTYEGLYTKLVGDDTKETDEEFSLVLNEDGTGKHNRQDMSFKVTWTVDGEKFKMSETFVGDPIEYTGTLKDGKLHLYNGDPKNDFTYEYFYEKN